MENDKFFVVPYMIRVNEAFANKIEEARKSSCFSKSSFLRYLLTLGLKKYESIESN